MTLWVKCLSYHSTQAWSKWGNLEWHHKTNQQLKDSYHSNLVKESHRADIKVEGSAVIFHKNHHYDIILCRLVAKQESFSGKKWLLLQRLFLMISKTKKTSKLSPPPDDGGLSHSQRIWLDKYWRACHAVNFSTTIWWIPGCDVQHSLL